MTALTPDQYRALADDVQHTVDNGYEFAPENVVAALRAAADQLEAVQEALSRHPKCDKYDEDEVVSCGWKSAVRDITWAVNQ